MTSDSKRLGSFDRNRRNDTSHRLLTSPNTTTYGISNEVLKHEINEKNKLLDGKNREIVKLRGDVEELRRALAKDSN